MDKQTAKAYAAALFQAVLVGFSFLFVKTALGRSSIFDLLAYRYVIAAALALLIYMLSRSPVRLTKQAFIRLAPYGLVYPILPFLFQALGAEHVGSSEAGIITATVPVLTLLIATVMIGERINSRQSLFMIITVGAVIGINLLNGLDPDNFSLYGVIMILLSAFMLALYSVMIRRIANEYPPFIINLVLNIVGASFFFVISSVIHIKNGNFGEAFALAGDMPFIGSVLFLSVACSVITVLLNAYALKTITASEIGITNNGSTIVSIIAGVVFLNEKLFLYHYIGIVLIIAGMIGFSRAGASDAD